MKTFLQPLQGLAEIEEIEKQAKKNHGILEVSGCIESQKAHLMYGLSGLFPSHLVIAADEKTAKDLYEDYRFYDKRVYYYPAKDLLFFQADIHGPSDPSAHAGHSCPFGTSGGDHGRHQY